MRGRKFNWEEFESYVATLAAILGLAVGFIAVMCVFAALGALVGGGFESGWTAVGFVLGACVVLWFAFFMAFSEPDR